MPARADLRDALKEKVVMKKFLALLFTLGVTLCTAATANAQALRFKIPFDFVVNGKILPASTYFVGKALPNNSTALAFVTDGQGAVATAIDLDDTVTGSTLVFRRIGDQYFLGDVVTLTGKLHFASSRTEAERTGAADAQSLTIAAN
jgi:hypothetical protein